MRRLEVLVASPYLLSGAAAWLAPDPLPPAPFVACEPGAPLELTASG